jgi:LmbE family N-acetylglucosaminyl deacetylase
MEPDKLLVVAHPDDEVLWGGANLLREPGWLVISATNASNAGRKIEFQKTMSYFNVTQFRMLDVPDTYIDEDEVGIDRATELANQLFDGSVLDTALAELTSKQWKLVLSHNTQGEYGHVHHKKVGQLVKKHFPNAVEFAVDSDLNPELDEIKRSGMVFYAKTQTITRLYYEKKKQEMDARFQDHIYREKLYVPRVRAIPLIVHQIWFGQEMKADDPRIVLFNQVKETAERNGFQYKLWSNAEFNADTLPLTFEYAQTALAKGQEYKTSRWAQVADLARYELLHRFGGVYLDSLFEISDAFCNYIKERATQFDLIVSNEDPCGLDCEGKNKFKYISNGFFACVPGCVSLKRVVHPKTLATIDFNSKFINRSTGPYLLRAGINAEKDNVHVIDTPLIYPVWIHNTEYRRAEPNPCLQDKSLIGKCLQEKYPNSIALYHSGLGGTWSWQTTTPS